MTQIVRLTHLPADIATLAAVAAEEGHGHITRLEQEFDSGLNRFEHAGEALFGVFVSGQLVGVGGVTRDPYVSDTDAGRIRRVYIHPDHRRRGLARALMRHIEAAAATHFTTLNLFTASDEASEFYLRLGYHRQHDHDKVSHSKPGSS